MKIFAIGMNYSEHNKSLHGTLSKTEQPVVFLKADSSLLKDSKPFFIPDDLGRIEYETELVVRICRLGKTIPERFAHRYYDAVTVGIDFTARDLQKKLKEQGHEGLISYCGTCAGTLSGRGCSMDHFLPHILGTGETADYKHSWTNRAKTKFK